MDSNTPANPSKPHRRWLRFSLRTLLLAMTVLCVWLAFQVNAARRQREAVTAILKAGGTVGYDYQMVLDKNYDDFSIDANTTPVGPKWLRNWVGDEYFREVVEVSFVNVVVPEPALAQVKELPGLQSIILPEKLIANDSGIERHLNDSDLAVLKHADLKKVAFGFVEVNGSGLAHIANLKHIRNLEVFYTPIDDTAMEQIGKMTDLECVSLINTRITDAGLAHLKHLTSLKCAWLDYTEITGAGMRYINSNQLWTLTLAHTAANDLGLEQIGVKISPLVILNLTACKGITDEGLIHLKKLSNLGNLSLMDTNISDAGLKYLLPLTKLKNLYLTGTRVTSEGVRDLQKSLPAAVIFGP